MSKSNLEKTMKNISLSDKGRGVKTKLRERFSLQVEITPRDIQRISSIMSFELNYFNHLLEAFSANVRSRPETIMSLGDTYEKLFGEVAYLQFNIATLYQKTPVEIPEKLKTFEKLLEKNNTNSSKIPADNLVLLEIAGTNGKGLHPLVRKNMALEMLKFHREQARLFAQTAGRGSENVYRVAPKSIEKPDVIRKRHIQLPKSLLDISWHEADDYSLIKINPYTLDHIKVHGVNLTESSDWNYFVLHQEPGSLPRPSTPWIAEFQKTNNLYLLNYLDTLNANSKMAFNIAQKKGYKHTTE